MPEQSGETLFPRGLLRPELFIGTLSSVGAHSVLFTLGRAGAPSGAHFLGGRYGRGEVGELVLIEGQVSVLLGRVVEVRLSDAESLSAKRGKSPKDELGAIGNIQLLGTVAMDSLRVTAGVEAYPRLGDRVYAAPHRFVAEVPRLMDKPTGLGEEVTLCLGTVGTASESVVRVRPEKLFGRHCAILGATGGGKSWTTARIIEECLRHDAKIILLDATGEYRGFGGEYVAHFHLGNPSDAAMESKRRSLPPNSFLESDFIALFQPAGKIQGPKLRAAIRSLRLAKLKPTLASNGIIEKIDRPKKAVTDAEAEPGIAVMLDDPRQEFDVSRLRQQIEQECVYPDAFGPQKGSKDTTKWGGDSGEVSFCLALLSRISLVLTSSAFGSVFKSDDPPITDSIEEFLGNGIRLMRICLSGIPFEFKARQIIANVLGRYLLGMSREGKFKTRPIVVFVDEAHNFLGGQIGDEDSVAKLDAFEMIAKEGRKYGLNLCLSTQRPQDMTAAVLSQVGTIIVHRLTNDRDREIVERACGEIDRAASAFLPNLQPGEAAVIGTDFPIPLTIQILPPTTLPLSTGPDYQSAWSQPLVSNVE